DLTARITDVAGNHSGASSGFTVTENTTTAPPSAVATVIALSADTGSSPSDFITNTASQTVSGTYTGTLGVGDKIQVSVDGNTWLDASASGGTWTVSGVTLSSGTGTLSVRTIDTTGNATAGTGHGFTLDTTLPSETISSTIGTDSGATTTISSGEVTKDNTLALSGTVSDANGVASVHVFDGLTDL